MHYVVLTNSRDNFEKLLTLPFAKELLNQTAPQSFQESPLAILFDTRDPAMLEIFLKNADRLGFDHTFIQDKLLFTLERFADLDQSANIARFVHQLDETHGKDFMIHLCCQQFSTHITEAILKILPLDEKKFSEIAKDLLNDKYVSDDKKVLLNKQLSSFNNAVRLGEEMHATLFSRDNASKQNVDDPKTINASLRKSQERPH